MRIISYVFISIIVFVSFGTVQSEEQSAVPTRWAVLADSQFGDLLFARLAMNSEIELVERERFQDILAEQNLSSLSGPGEIGQRIQLGRMLVANRLATLREIVENGKKRQRLAVFDISSGATVFDATFFDRTDAESVAEAAASVIENLNREYKEGVRAVVAVPDFLSTDSLLESKPYGPAFARLIAVSLLRSPGIAVVSFEELQSLQRELQLGDGEIRRTVPLFVRGEFKARKNGEVLLFDVSLKISDGKDDMKFVSKNDLTEKTIAEYLGSEIPNEIIRQLGEQEPVPLTSRQQEEEFSKVATRFHEFGLYEYAMKYRQAILLLNPKNAIERLRMLSEQYSLHGGKVPFEQVYPHLKYLYANKVISFEMGAGAYWGLAYSTNYVVGARPTPHEVDCEMLPLLFQLPPAKNKAESGFRYLWNAPTNDPRYEPRWGADAPFPPEVLRQLDRRSLLRIYINRSWRNPDTVLSDALPMLRAYPENGIPNLTENERGHQRAPVLREALERDDDQTKRFIGELRNSKLENLIFLADFLELYLDTETRERWDTVSSERLDDLKNRLKKLTHKDYEKHKHNEFFADYLYFHCFLDSVEEKQKQKLARNNDDADYLGFENPLDLPSATPIEIDAAFTLTEIPEWAKIIEQYFSFPITIQKAYYEPNERTRFDVKLENHDAEMDVLWNPGAICTIRRDADKKITSQKIFAIPDGSRILRVKSDGKRLWVSTTEGIICLDIFGGESFRIGREDGLPDFTAPKPPQGGYSWMRRHAMYLSENIMRDAMAIVGDGQYVLAIHPVDDGDVLVFGRFGERQQTWIARIRLDETTKTPSLKILLEANRTLPSESAYNRPEIHETDENKDLACTISTVCELNGDSDSREIILGRYFGRRVEASPLLVDLKTDEVTTLAERYPSLKELRSSSGMESAAGSIVSVHFSLVGTPGHENFRKLIFSPFQVKDDNMTFTLGMLTVWQRVAEKEWNKIPVSIKDLFKEKTYYNQGPILYRDETSIYSFGEPWLKLDFSNDSYRLEKLAEEAIPAAFFGRHQDPSNGTSIGASEAVERIGCVSRSAVFGTWVGLVAPGDVEYSIRPETAFRVDWNTPMKKTLPAEARYVATGALEKHVTAAERIRSLGGYVGNNAQFEKARFKTIFGQQYNRNVEPQRTVVVLPDSWKGNANDLKLLADLERFEELYLFDRTISRDEAEAIAEAKNLRYLYFVRSSFAHEAVEIMPWNSIRRLCLYPDPKGADFDEGTLETLFRQRCPDGLVLVGPCFTDRTAKLLLEKHFNSLRLVKTNISRESRDRLKTNLSRTGASSMNFLDE